MMLVAGIDEVGMGPIAGPVVVAGVVIEEGSVVGVRDSKLVEEPERFRLAEEIRKNAAFWVVKRADVEFVNRAGNRAAWDRCTARCIGGIRQAYPSIEICVDGAILPGRHDLTGVKAVINGDDTMYAIAAASLVAKAYRDAEMIELAKVYPQYGFEKHKGYGTERHWEAIDKYGLTPIHRKTMLERSKSKQAAKIEELNLTKDVQLAMLTEIETIGKTVDIGDWNRRFVDSIRKGVDEKRDLSLRQQFYLQKTLDGARKRSKVKGALSDGQSDLSV